MRIPESSEHHTGLLSNIAVITVFVGLMAAAIVYFYNSDPDVKDEMMRTLAQQFERSVTNAHWQWQAEGRPQIIMLVHYDFGGKETGRRPIRMAANGYPFVDDNSDSCESLWQGILNMPARLDNFRVVPEYYNDGVDDNGQVQQRCRFRVSTGPYFDYYVNSGRVMTDE